MGTHRLNQPWSLKCFRKKGIMPRSMFRRKPNCFWVTYVLKPMHTLVQFLAFWKRTIQKCCSTLWLYINAESLSNVNYIPQLERIRLTFIRKPYNNHISALLVNVTTCLLLCSIEPRISTSTSISPLTSSSAEIWKQWGVCRQPTVIGNIPTNNIHVSRKWARVWFFKMRDGTLRKAM